MEPGAFVLLEEPAERGWPRGFGPLRPQLTAHQSLLKLLSAWEAVGL